MRVKLPSLKYIYKILTIALIVIVIYEVGFPSIQQEERRSKIKTRPVEEPFNMVSKTYDCINPVDPKSPPVVNNGFQNWLTSLNDGDHSSTSTRQNSYTNHVYIPTKENECEGAGFLWNIVGDQLHIAVAAVASDWIAFGVSEMGSLVGSDVFFYTAANDIIMDGYILDHRVAAPSKDLIQDWELVESTITDDGYMIVEAVRALDTGDATHDWKIYDDSDDFHPGHKFYFTWGDSPMTASTFYEKAKTTIKIHSRSTTLSETAYDIFIEDMDERSDGSFVVQLENHIIPDSPEDTHVTVCWDMSELIDLKAFTDENEIIYVIGFRVVQDRDISKKYVHHMNVYGGNSKSCDDPFNARIFGSSGGGELDHFQTTPTDVGIKYGGNSFKSIHMNYHFNNKSLDKGLIDNGTGVRVWYTRRSLKHEVKLLPFKTKKEDVQHMDAGDKRLTNKLKFNCENRDLGDDIRILGEYVHMHDHAMRAIIQVFRDGVEHHHSEIQYWDYTQTANPQMNTPPYPAKIGDEILVTCYYHLEEKIEIAGMTDGEMCLVVIAYFMEEGEACNHVQEKTYLSLVEDILQEDNFGRRFGYVDGKFLTSIGDDSSSISDSMEDTKDEATPNVVVKAMTEPHVESHVEPHVFNDEDSS